MLNQFSRIIIVLVALITLAACSSTKRKVLKPVKLEPIQAELKLKTLWTKRIGKLGKYYHQFNIATDSTYLYAASAKGRVVKFDKHKGKKQWQVVLKTPITTGVAVDSYHVYVATLDGVLLALDKHSGEQVWSYQADSEITAPPAVDDNHVVFQTLSGEVFNLASHNGKKIWQQATNMPVLTLRGNNRPVFFADTVIVGTANGRIAIFSLATGELHWDPRVAVPQGESEIERMVDVDSTPIIDEDRIYAVSYQGQIMALSLSQGQTLWQSDESSYKDLARGMGNIYVSSADSQVNAYSERTGDVRWAQDGLLRRKISAPSTVSSYVAVADYKGYIHLMSQIDGRFVARKRNGKKGVKTNIHVDGRRFYVLGNNGRLRAYELGKTIERK